MSVFFKLLKNFYKSFFKYLTSKTGQLPSNPAEDLELPKLKSHEAKRRHMQFIGRLMRELEDPTALIETLEARRRG